MKESLESIRHARSKKDFPFLSLEEGEYVELAITRAKISLIITWFLSIASILLLLLCSIILPNLVLPELFPEDIVTPFAGGIKSIFSLVFIIIFVLIIVITLISTKIHFGNKMFITNLRIIQISTAGLFSSMTSVVELSRIEDVSFKQENVTQKIFGYGTIRMSTVGDETTYTFPFVTTPTDEVQTISHLVHLAREKKTEEKG